MRATNLAILAGVGAPLILSASASAGFVGIKVVQKTVQGENPFGLWVCNVYAVFDRPNDEMIAVAGTPDRPLNIFTKNGAPFYQNAQGSVLTAPFLQFIPPPPNNQLAYDSFVTIGTKVDDLFSTLDNVSTTPGLGFAPGTNPNPVGAPNLNNGSLSTISGSWFILPSGPGNGGLGAPNANGQVLIGQFSVFKDVPGAGVKGTLLLQFTSNGVPGVHFYGEFDHNVPAPGALALLGLGAAVGARRRRR